MPTQAMILLPVCKAPAEAEPAGQLLEGHKVQNELLVSIPCPCQVHGLVSIREAGLQDLVLHSLQATVWGILRAKHRTWRMITDDVHVIIGQVLGLSPRVSPVQRSNLKCGLVSS